MTEFFGLVWEVVLGFVLGVLGLVPFLHTNTLLAALPQASPLLVAALVFSHLAFEALPAVFFGIPTSGHPLSALPAHYLVRSGQGRVALDAALAGLLGGFFGAVLLGAVFWFLGPVVFSFVKPLTEWFLLAVVLLVWASDGWRLLHLGSFAVFGVLGMAVFALPINEPLFPLLSGLFGVPALLFGGRVSGFVFGRTVAVPLWPLFAGSVLGGLSVFLPALSPAFVGSVALLFVSASPVEVVALLSAVSSSRAVFDFLGVLVLHTARSAAAVTWRQARLAPDQGLVFLVFASVGLLAAVGCVFLLCKAWLSAFRLVSIKLLLGVLLAASVVGAWILDGPWGVFVLAWACAASVVSLRLKIPRKYACGALVLPALAHAWLVA